VPVSRRADRSVRTLAPVSQLAEELGVCWWTVMTAVIEHGTPLVDDPDRVGLVRQLGVTSGSVWSKATRLLTCGDGPPTLPDWLSGIKVVATDLAESFRAGLSPHLDHARRVADPFRVVRVANRCVDQVRRRVQNATLGHRGRKHDPLFRIRKLPLTGSERLDERGTDRMPLGLRPIEELCTPLAAQAVVRAVTLAHLDAALRGTNEAATFLEGDLSAGLAAHNVDAVVDRVP
jgi:hypothetical protein